MRPALDLLLCDEREEALDLIDPGRRRRHEVNVPLRPPGEPVANEPALVARRVVHDDMDVELTRHIR